MRKGISMISPQKLVQLLLLGVEGIAQLDDLILSLRQLRFHLQAIGLEHRFLGKILLRNPVCLFVLLDHMPAAASSALSVCRAA